MIDGAPEVMLNVIDFSEDLVEKPLPLGVLAHIRRPLRSYFAGEDRTETFNSEPHTFMTDIDAALVEQVFDIAK